MFRLRFITIAIAAVLLSATSFAGNFSVMYSFTGSADGGDPMAGVTPGLKGSLYGTTAGGGTYGYGTVFEISKTGKETVLYSFTEGAEGGVPASGVVRDTAGNLYGTSQGGPLSDGTVFKLDTTGKVTVLYSFTGTGGDGASPEAGLVRDAKGNLYGTTFYGGAAGSPYGTMFELNAAGKEIGLYDFGGQPTGDGAWPSADLIRDKKGNLYGTTYGGGNSGCNCGTVFTITKTRKLSVLYSFVGDGNGPDGSYPIAALVQDANGNLYGATQAGGASGKGAVFEVDTAGKETVLYSFSGTGGDGANPYAGLALDAKGNLYGTTLNGGNLGYGTVFMLDSTGKETILHSFSATDGAAPRASLVADKKGNLYGTTSAGGASGAGTVFKLTP